jgi:hypothetical protein
MIIDIDGKHAIEIPLLGMTSPLTLIKTAGFEKIREVYDAIPDTKNKLTIL